MGLLISCSPNIWATAPAPDLKSQRALFVQAEKKLAKREWDSYEKLKKQLHNYPLLPHLLFKEYNSKLHEVTEQQFTQFIENYADSPLAEKLRENWLKDKAQKEDWQAYLKAYQPTQDVALQCDYLWGSLQVQNDYDLILQQIAPLWLTGKTPPKNCHAPFSAFEKSPARTRAKVWQRIKLLIQEDNPKLARKMASYLRKDEIALVELWLMIRKNPHLVMKKKYFSREHPADLEMIVDGVSLIAKKHPNEAIKIWKRLARQYPFTERHWGLVVRAIGLKFAEQKNPDAEKWLSRVPTLYANHAVHEKRLRLALIREDWPQALTWINQLPKDLASKEEWQYWQARTLDILSRRTESQSILSRLAKSRSYYGLLASQMLLKPHSIGEHSMLVQRSLVRSVAERRAIQGARELQLLGRTHNAKSEWLHITRQMTDKEKHAAARLAMQWKLPNWSIWALSNANHKDDLSLRFPMAYTNRIFSEAKKNKIDPAWVFAVTRRESAFVPHAKSPSGAMGLMQVMPSTAKMVAQRKKIPYTKQDELFEPHTNIKLGTGYLKMMLDRHQNNSVLATAAYNAGPGNVGKWLPTFDMAADLWIETIPFKETREYVKGVLTYTAVYQEILGRHTSIARYMPFIPKAPSKTSKLTYKPNKLKHLPPPQQTELSARKDSQNSPSC